jgi:hypothetical protein
MRVRQFCWLVAAWCLAGFSPVVRALEPSVAAVQRQISEEELRRGVALVIERVPQLHRAAQIAHEAGLSTWLVGGAAASVAFYAKDQLARFGAIPNAIHYYDVFSPGQDIDLVGDGDVAKVQALNEALNNFESLKIRIQGKSAWDVITMRPHNGRGFVGHDDLYLQHSDSLSLGLVRFDDLTAELADIRWAQNFDNGGENPFLTSILEGRIEYYYRDTHAQNSQVVAGRNPEILSVLRLLNKAARTSFTISDAHRAQALAVVAEFLESGEKPVDYVQGRMNRIVRTMIIGSRDTTYTLKLLRDFKVLKVLRKAAIPFAHLRDVTRLARAMVRTRDGMAFGAFQRVPVDHVTIMPDGAIFEGTMLHGGERAPAIVFPSALLGEPEVLEAQSVWRDRDKSLPGAVAAKLSQLAYQLAKRILPTPSIVILSDVPRAWADCRDYSLVGHMLFSVAGIPSLISSNQTNTKVYIEIGDSRYLLNTHHGSFDSVAINTATYYQSIWVRRGQDYGKLNEKYLRTHFERVLRQLDRNISRDEMKNYVEAIPGAVERFVETRREQLPSVNDITTLLRLASQSEVLGSRGAELLEMVQERLSERVSDLPQLTNADWRALRGQITYAHTPLPETDLTLKILHAVLSSAHRHTSIASELDTKFVVEVLENIQHWGHGERRRAAFVMLITQVSLETMNDDRVSDMIAEFFKPDPELLPIARQILTTKNMRFFSSKGFPHSIYSDPQLPAEEFDELIRHDRNLIMNERNSTILEDLWQALEAKAIAGDALARDKLYRLLQFSALESRLILYSRIRDGIEKLISTFVFGSPLADEAPFAKIVDTLIFQQKSFLVETLSSPEMPLFSFARLRRVMIGSTLDNPAGAQRHLRTEIKAHLYQKAFSKFSESPQSLQEAMATIEEITGGTWDDEQVKIVPPSSETFLSTIRHLDLVDAKVLVRLFDRSEDIARLRVARALYQVHGEPLFTGDHEIEPIVTAYARGTYTPIDLAQIFESLASRDDFRFEKYFTHEELSRADEHSLTVLFRSIGGEWDRRSQIVLRLVRLFRDNAFLRTRPFYEITEHHLVGALTSYAGQRRLPAFAKALLDSKHDLPPALVLTVKLNLQAMLEQERVWQSEGARRAAIDLVTRADALLARHTSRNPLMSSGPSEANRLCETYLHRLL